MPLKIHCWKSLREKRRKFIFYVLMRHPVSNAMKTLFDGQDNNGKRLTLYLLVIRLTTIPDNCHNGDDLVLLVHLIHEDLIEVHEKSRSLWHVHNSIV